jgi:N-acetylneuraminic acid mutarotase
MGKKGNNADKKKAAKQQRAGQKQDKSSKKAGKVFGNDDIDAILADFEEQDRKKANVCTYPIEEIPPRVNAIFGAHPNTDNLIFQGGEHFNGNKVSCYSDIYVFNTAKNEYKHIVAPNSPIRSGHQGVIVNQDQNAYLYVFAGDFTSPSQIFKHYNDIWVCDLATYKWEQIIAPGGPSIRSGHRMVLGKRGIYVFGGFYDNHQSIKYFNDFFKFDLDTRKWEKLGPGVAPGSNKGKLTATEIAALANAPWPTPRSGFGFTFHESTNSIFLYGGYCTQTKKNSLEESANVLSDLWQYSLQTNSWTQLKQTGHLPAGRSACQLFTYQNHIFLFGGVKDVERKIEKKLSKREQRQTDNPDDGNIEDGDDDDDDDDGPEINNDDGMINISKKKKKKKKGSGGDDDDDEYVIESQFSNEMLIYSIKHKRWFKIPLNVGVNPLIKEQVPVGPVETVGEVIEEVKEDGKKKEAVAWNWNSAKEQEQKLKDQQKALAERRQRLEAEREAELLAMVAKQEQDDDSEDESDKKKSKITPVNFLWPRRNAMVSVKNGILYLYGGAFERENVEVILNDLHFLDLKKVLKNFDVEKASTTPHQPVAAKAGNSMSSSSLEDESVGTWQCVTEANLLKFSWFEEKYDDNDDSDEEEELNLSDDDDDDDESDGDEGADDAPKKPTRVPPIDGFATGKDYFKSDEEFWKGEALAEAADGTSDKDLRQMGFKLAKKYFEMMKKKQ